MVDGYVLTITHRFTIFSFCTNAISTVEANDAMTLPVFITRVRQDRQIKSVFGAAPTPFLRPGIVSLASIDRKVLVKRRNFNEEWNVSRFFVIVFFTNSENESSICDRIWTIERFYKFRSSPGCNSIFAYLCKHLCRVSDWRKGFSPCLTTLFYWVLRGGVKNAFKFSSI